MLAKLMKEKNNNGEVILTVDYNISNNKYVDFDDVTKVLYEQLYR